MTRGHDGSMLVQAGIQLGHDAAIYFGFEFEDSPLFVWAEKI